MLNACFLGVPAKTEVHRPPGFRNIFAAMAASDVYECIPAVKGIICSHIPLLRAGGTKLNFIAIISLMHIIPIIFIA